MSSNEDKYPVESDRRRFVKGVVGAGAIAALGSTGAAAVNTATAPTGSGGGITPFMGIENTGGPAPRGMPIIPVQIGDDGTISGRWPEVVEEEVQGQTVVLAQEELGGITYSSQWFQYCGKQTSPALLPDADQDNRFLASGQAQYEWQSELEEGAPLNISDFEDYEEWGNEIGSEGVGKPAAATWRSNGLDSASTLGVTVIRSPLIEEAAQDDEFLQAATQDGVFAYLNVCTHFCCVPGYKVNETAERVSDGNTVYCQCHGSVYDPFTILEQSFLSFPQPDDVQLPEGAGGGGGGGSSESGESSSGGGGNGNESGSGGNESGGNESTGGNETGGGSGGNESAGGNESGGGQ
ncbi:Rieske 2Fe-2S domain-containing protein [Halalkalicoccus jeotgali]|uniref:Rieske (2Fe-2S) domain-containing protein n=1 Tax=Halalkalicoccus jeotgali (strain DSM 18796 / CECT 7217 / JCM 14584 / KCTC 4019 / B3) TaxID=795797 RepID=D8J4Y9_HALJB|nr:Rieske (2Fe-2S) domain-containing protein [Halalkalicoccus jeotgali B3]ELY36316.1 Rieske (2Fe-2S) domain-containing protein [Halalkalicoccus jeotgali B3]